MVQDMIPLAGKTIFITGASRGIGREIALRCAKEKANIVIASKSAEPHPKLPGTIYSVAKEVEEAGGKALPLRLDVRNELEINDCVNQAVSTFGGIDVLINNAGAIAIAPTLDMTMKKFDLIFGVNVRAAFACSQACIPWLKKATNPHILNMSPPLNMNPKWFKDHLVYTMSKYGMSMCTLGMAEEWKGAIAVNSLWPKTLIATAAIEVFFKDSLSGCRKPAIVAEAAYKIITSPSKELTGNFFIDEDFLRKCGMTDFSEYALNPKEKLITDLFLE